MSQTSPSYNPHLESAYLNAPQSSPVNGSAQQSHTLASPSPHTDYAHTNVRNDDSSAFEAPADHAAWSFGRIDTASTSSQTNSTPQAHTTPSSAAESHSHPSSVAGDSAKPAQRQAIGKRVRDLEAEATDAPASKRPTPELSASTTAPQMARQDSNDSFLAEMLGDSYAQDQERFRQAQLEIEELNRQSRIRRQKQEKEDEEYARKLHEEFNGPLVDLPAAQRPAPQRAPTTQGVLGPNGQVRRLDPSAPAPNLQFQREPTRPVKPEPAIYNDLNSSPSTLPVRKHDPSYVNIDSDDDEIEFLGSHPIANREGSNQGGRILPWYSASGSSASRAPTFDMASRQLSDPRRMAGQVVQPHQMSHAGSSGSVRLPGIGSMRSLHGAVGSNVYESPLERLRANPYISHPQMPGSYGSFAGGLSDPGAPDGTHGVRGYGLHESFPGAILARMPWGRDSDEPDDNSWDDYDHAGAYDGWNDQGSAEALKDLLNNIRPDEEENLGSDDRDGSPEGMADTAALYKYQVKGLNWLAKMEESTSKGSILADDMGLGKTIQAIALMVSRPSTDPNCKTNLIIAPVALIRQWESEIASKIRPSHRLTTFIYHGTGAGKKNATFKSMSEYDVVITTYGALQTDLKKRLQLEKTMKDNPNARPQQKDKPVLVGHSCKWYRIILDEAQNIKNKNAKTSLAAYELRSEYKLCMTGTPMMNNVVELFSLIHFLGIQPYCQWNKFNLDFARPLKPTGTRLGRERAMQKVQALCKAVMLRRTKKSEMDGKPLVVLPERVIEQAEATFDSDEQAFYTALESKTQLTFNKYMKAGTVGKYYSNVLVLLLRLRQAACHPHLIKDFAVSIESNPDALMEAARGLPDDAVRRLLTEGIGECCICMDAATNYNIFHPCGHSTCPECFCRLSDAAQNEAAATDGTGKAPFTCHTCRAKVDPHKVTDWVHFRKIHAPDLAAEDGIRDIIEDMSNADDDSDEDGSDEEDEESDLDGFVARDDDPVEKQSDSDDADSDDLDDVKPARSQSKRKAAKKQVKLEHDETDEGDDEDYRGGSNPFERASGKKLERTPGSKGKGKARDKKPNNRKTLAQLKKEGLRSRKAHRVYMKRLSKDFVPSAKTNKTMEILNSIRASRSGEKTIVFSQFTSLLDLVEIPISKGGYKYTRFDGSMNAVDRNNAVQLFTHDPNYTVMLISLKAGNAGLNLTAASQVVILDPFWNPYIEEQAIDRAHRIGQRRTVQIHRVLVMETVETRILTLQEKKRELIEGALDENAANAVGRLGVRELAYLFGVSSG